MLQIFSRLKSIQGIQKEKIFLLSMMFVMGFAVLYYISDYPLETKRRKVNKKGEYGELNFIDYFVFSLGTWTTVSPGHKVYDAKWARNTYYIYICQLVTILGSLTFLFV
tara:strand:+ start:32 stop:358 length:327 start_codon:yes stop_codon:yes gene_type:complete